MFAMRQVPPSEIRASAYFLNHAPAHAMLVLAVANFPARLNGNYVVHDTNQQSNDPALTSSPRFDNNGLTHVSPKSLAKDVERLAHGSGYLVIAPSMTRFDQYYGTVTPGTLTLLAARLKESPYWKIWYHQGGVEIFRPETPFGSRPP